MYRYLILSLAIIIATTLAVATEDPDEGWAEPAARLTSSEDVFWSWRWLDRRSVSLQRMELGPDAFDRAMQLFARDLRLQRTTLNDLRKSGDAEQIRVIAVQLRTSSGDFGARTLAAYAADLETVAADGDWASIEARLDRLRSAIDATLGSLERAGAQGQ